MSYPFLNRALLEKEWRNRGYFLTAALLLIYCPMLKTLVQICRGGAATSSIWGNYLNYMLHFGVGVVRPQSYDGMMVWLPGLAAILLGALVLGEERKGSLSYLVSTPVSRREIILAKFLPGAGVIIGAMALNALFLAGLDLIYSLPYNTVDVFNWALLLTSACLAFYSLALLVSTFAAGVLATGCICFFLSFLPRMIMSMAGNITERYFHVSQAVSIKLYYSGSYLSIGDYITRSGRDHITSIHYSHNSIIMTAVASNGSLTPDYIQESLFLLLGVLIFLFLAVKIFEHTSLEISGTIFATKKARRVCLIFLTIFFSYLLVLPRTHSFMHFFLYMALLSLIIYKGGRFIRKRWRGKRFQPAR